MRHLCHRLQALKRCDTGTGAIGGLRPMVLCSGDMSSQCEDVVAFACSCDYNQIVQKLVWTPGSSTDEQMRDSSRSSVRSRGAAKFRSSEIYMLT